MIRRYQPTERKLVRLTRKGLPEGGRHRAAQHAQLVGGLQGHLHDGQGQHLPIGDRHVDLHGLAEEGVLVAEVMLVGDAGQGEVVPNAHQHP